MLFILFINSPIQSWKKALYLITSASPLIYKINTQLTDNKLFYRVISLALSYSMQSSKTLTFIYTIYFSKFYFLRKLLIFMHSYFGLQTVPLTNELTRRSSILHLLARIHSMIPWPHRDLATGYLGDRSAMCFCRSVLMMSV